eukprot:CAMPEP_0195306422 /NCGR_PEP_ID=MMETSP0707-20130614/37193_1 /TAXON_ID=33640 /ORGANISM="Asterionellopsis glacialis, Strain CCMP134" /LENGTH=688 /DNA_ID=CAMNT_0040370639 /DNA_START=63 /DNA_END=2129 /DNA_ORIENTATION=-
MTREIVEEVCPAEWLLRIVGRALKSTDVVGKTVKLVYGDEYSTIIGVEKDPTPESVDKELSVGLAMTYDGVQPRENYGLNPQNCLFDQILFSMETNGKKRPPHLWIQTKAPSWTSMHRQGYVPNPTRKRMLKVWRASEGDDFKVGEIRMIEDITPPTSMGPPLTEASLPQAPTAPAPADTSSKPAEETEKKRKRTKKDNGSKKQEKPEDVKKGEKPEEEAEKKQTDVPVENPPPAKKSKTSVDESKSAAPSKDKNKKDPNAPKKSPSAYILYSNSIREEVQKTNPEAKFTDMGKLTGGKWKQLSAEDKKDWIDKALAEKEKYMAAKKRYDTEAKEKSQAEEEPVENPTGTEDEVAKEGVSATPMAKVAKVAKVTGKKKSAIKDPNAPKRPKPSYIYYQNKRRPILAKENPGKPFGDIARMISAEWKTLSEDLRKIYTSKAQEDKKRYEEEMVTYVPPTIDEVIDKATEKKNAKKRKKKDPNYPKSPLSAYILFSNSIRAEVQKKNPENSFLSMGKTLGEEWKKLSDAEKQKWKDLAKKGQIEYEKKLKAYEANVAGQEVSAATATKVPNAKKSKEDDKNEDKNEDKDSDEAPVAPPESPPSKNATTPSVEDTSSSPPKSAAKKTKKMKKKKDTTAISIPQAEPSTPSKASTKSKKSKSTRKGPAKRQEDTVTPSAPSSPVRRSKRGKK